MKAKVLKSINAEIDNKLEVIQKKRNYLYVRMKRAIKQKRNSFLASGGYSYKETFNKGEYSIIIGEDENVKYLVGVRIEFDDKMWRREDKITDIKIGIVYTQFESLDQAQNDVNLKLEVANKLNENKQSFIDAYNDTLDAYETLGKKFNEKYDEEEKTLNHIKSKNNLEIEQIEEQEALDNLMKGVELRENSHWRGSLEVKYGDSINWKYLKIDKISSSGKTASITVGNGYHKHTMDRVKMSNILFSYKYNKELAITK